MIKVTLFWKAFSKEQADIVALSFTIEKQLTHLQVLHDAFQSTNLYRGPIWDLIKDRLPEGRSHTALSIGDEIEIQQVFADGDGVWELTHLYRCESSGWSVQGTHLRPLVQIKNEQMLKSLAESN